MKKKSNEEGRRGEMSEDNTKDLTPDEKLERILAELNEFKAWRGRVDAFIEDRSRDTRSKLEVIHQEIHSTRTEMREGFNNLSVRLRHIEKKLDVLAADVIDVRTVQAELEEHIKDLERSRE
jgi:tetrahydromethanopterin S-methyltransferase subunit G